MCIGYKRPTVKPWSICSVFSSHAIRRWMYVFSNLDGFFFLSFLYSSVWCMMCFLSGTEPRASALWCAHHRLEPSRTGTAVLAMLCVVDSTPSSPCCRGRLALMVRSLCAVLPCRSDVFFIMTTVRTSAPWLAWRWMPWQPDTFWKYSQLSSFDWHSLKTAKLEASLGRCAKLMFQYGRQSRSALKTVFFMSSRHTSFLSNYSAT